MIISPYSTTACRGYNLVEIQQALAKALVVNEIGVEPVLTEQVNTNIIVVTPLRFQSVIIKPFAHPIHFKTVDGEDRIAIDARSMVSQRADRNASPSLRSRNEFAMLLARAVMQQCWDNGHYSDIRNISPIPHQLYQRWVSEVVSRQYNLAPEVQAKIACIAAHFYSCQFKENGDDMNRTMHESNLSRVTGIGTAFIKEALDGVPFIGNLTEFCQAVRERNWSIRLENFTPAIMIQILAGSWMGQHAREMVAVALEHPPTFTVLVYEAINDRGGKKTRLGDILHRSYNKGDNFAVFSTNYRRCLDHWRG
jgi:hypothetical protein